VKLSCFVIKHTRKPHFVLWRGSQRLGLFKTLYVSPTLIFTNRGAQCRTQVNFNFPQLNFTRMLKHYRYNLTNYHKVPQSRIVFYKILFLPLEYISLLHQLLNYLVDFNIKIYISCILIFFLPLLKNLFKNVNII